MQNSTGELICIDVYTNGGDKPSRIIACRLEDGAMAHLGWLIGRQDVSKFVIERRTLEEYEASRAHLMTPRGGLAALYPPLPAAEILMGLQVKVSEEVTKETLFFIHKRRRDESGLCPIRAHKFKLNFDAQESNQPAPVEGVETEHSVPGDPLRHPDSEG